MIQIQLEGLSNTVAKSRGQKRRFGTYIQWIRLERRPQERKERDVMQPGVFMVILFAGVWSIYLDNIPLVIRNLRVRLILELLRCLVSRLGETEIAKLEATRTAWFMLTVCLTTGSGRRNTHTRPHK